MSIHIGRIIDHRLGKLGMTKSEFARRINKARQNINDILNRKSIDTDLLLSISRALDYDFFQHFVIEVNEQDMISEPASEYHDLRGKVINCEQNLLLAEQEVKSLQKEIQLMNHIIDLYKKQEGGGEE